MSNSKSILVIDDDKDFCKMVRKALVRTGYDVTTSSYPIVAAEQAP